MDPMNDKLSIKNLLFTKAIPNFVIPFPVNGHKVFGCTDCGDKFILESSYNDHINRKSAKISYMCRLCNRQKVFYNRCNLLCHIRSHSFKTATINVSDLKLEVLPLSFFKLKRNETSPNTPTTSKQVVISNKSKPLICFECKKDITFTGTAFKDRTSHWMQYTNEVFSCPVCLFALPSICALKIHLRLHLKCPPYYCPECGIHLSIKNVQYPYNHDCEGFKMMRATARLNCSVPDCCLFHPNDYKDHMAKYHLKKVYKCPFCVVACFNEATMEIHLKGHDTDVKPTLFYQCDICPGRFVLQHPKLNDQHLKSHINTSIFPCWACGSAFKEVSSLLTHFIKRHNKTEIVKTALNALLNYCALQAGKPKRIYRVVKRCEQCKRSFTYKCKYEEIRVLPNECPFKCTSTMESNVTAEQEQHMNEDKYITCPLCHNKILQNWKVIKKHYAELHESHKCLDVEIKLTDIRKDQYKKKIANNSRPNVKTINKAISKKTRQRQLVKSSISVKPTPVHDIRTDEADEFCVCNMCGQHCEDKSALEKHMISHKDPCMAYQCMECGQSFVVKPTFWKHLLLEHQITDVEEYIKNKQCYNENALMKYQDSIQISDEPLKENQCRICREEFEGPEHLEKHFRVHGMAFLMKNKNNS